MQALVTQTADVDELQTHADALAAARERHEQLLTRFAVLFAAMPVAALLVAVRGEIVEHNPRAASLFGLHQRSGSRRFLHRLLDDAVDQRRVRPALQAARDTGAHTIDGVGFIAQDGRRFIGELHIARLPGADSGEMQFACTVIECSQVQDAAARLLAAKEAAESASHAKTAFLSRMSHELRTPLNAILGFSQLMRLEAEAGDLVLKPHRVTLIETAARHLLELVNEVLDVSHIESGQVQLRLSAFPLQAVVAEAMPLLQGLADNAGVSLHDHLQGLPPLRVQGDRLRLKEVLINLLSNAIKYNVAGGRVDIGVQAVGDNLCLSVSDTGRGLDALQMAGMFQPFNRLGAEASSIEGSGMGLFVSRRFVELMGGSIAVDSRLGAGTTFTVRLQAAQSM